jgi:hypothetical protein
MLSVGPAFIEMPDDADANGSPPGGIRGRMDVK